MWMPFLTIYITHWTLHQTLAWLFRCLSYQFHTMFDATQYLFTYDKKYVLFGSEGLFFVYIRSLLKGMYCVYPCAKELICDSLAFDPMLVRCKKWITRSKPRSSDYSQTAVYSKWKGEVCQAKEKINHVIKANQHMNNSRICWYSFLCWIFVPFAFIFINCIQDNIE